MRRLSLPALLPYAGYAACVALLGACDFGTLDALSEETAPNDIPELSEKTRALWNLYDKGSDVAVKRAIADLPAVIDRAGTPPIQAKMGDLTKEDLDLVGKTADPAAPQGMLLISDLDCSLDQVERLVVAKNQTQLYPDLYDAYQRTFATSVQDFLGRKSPTVVWHTDYTASAVSRTYIAGLTGSARHVVGASPMGGDVLLSRTVLDAPANFIKGDSASFNQDYQIELYYEIAPKKVRHMYGLWREFTIAGLTAESDLYVNLVLGNLEDFDVHTSKVCRNSAPVAVFQ